MVARSWKLCASSRALLRLQTSSFTILETLWYVIAIKLFDIKTKYKSTYMAGHSGLSGEWVAGSQSMPGAVGALLSEGMGLLNYGMQSCFIYLNIEYVYTVYLLLSLWHVA